MDLLKRLPSISNLWTAFAVVLVLNMLDAYSTMLLVMLFGTIEVEANPIMKYAMELYGIPGMYGLKLAVVGFLALVVMFVIRNHLQERAAIMAHRSMWLINVVMSYIVVNNFILVAIAINS